MRVGRLALACAWLLVGCEGQSALVVDLRTDLAPGVEFDHVAVRFADGTLTETAVTRDQDFVAGVRVASRMVAPGPTRLVVSLRLTPALEGAAPVVVAERPLLVDVRAAAVAATLLVTRGCRGVECPGPGDPASATACHGGTCHEPTCTAETPDECAADECAADADCAAPATCAVPFCIEGLCFFAQGDECTEDQYCDPLLGCIPYGSFPCDPGSECRCPAFTACDIVCPAGGCTVECGIESSCGLDCPGGGCTVDCRESAFCTALCEGDGCALDCGETTSCEMACSGDTACLVADCPLACRQACDAAGACRVE